MATFTKKILSGSTDGRGVLVAAASSPGTTIHTGSSTASVIQEIWLYVSNPDTAQYILTVEWGGTTSPDDRIVLPVPAQVGFLLVSPGLIIKGNATPLVVRAFASTGSKLTIMGYVNEIS